MSEATAVLDPPATTTETTARTQAETKGEEVKNLVTDGDTSVQTETSDGEKTASTPEDADPHAAELAAEAAKAEKAADDIRIKEEAANLVKAEKAAEKAKELKERRSTQTARSQQETKGLLDVLKSDYVITSRRTGEEFPISDAVYKQFSDPINNVSLVAQQVEADKTRDAIEAHIPEADRPDFWSEREKADPELHTEGVIGALIERAVKEAKKPLASLDAAKEASPAIAKELVKLRSTEYKAGQANPFGTRDNSAEGKPSSAGVSYADFQKLPETEKQAFIKRNPDKFKAFLGIK